MGATAKGRRVCGFSSSIRQILAVVPPMSYDNTFPSRHCRAISPAKIAPPAGPDSTSRPGKRLAPTPALPTTRGGETPPPRRPRWGEPHRKADRGLDRGQPAARQHQKQRTEKTFAPQHRFEIGEVTSHPRLDIWI